MHIVDRLPVRLLRHGGVASAALVGLLAAAAVHAAPSTTVGDGLRLNPDREDWPQWQARLSIGAQPLGSAPNMLDSRLALGASLAGDHYFNIGRVGDGGGFRATGALLFGTPSVALSAPSGYGTSSLVSRSSLAPASNAGFGDSALDASATPYLGMGYTAWWARSGLGLSADLGLLATRGSTARRLLSGASSSLDDPTHTYQFAPVLQVQLSYSF